MFHGHRGRGQLSAVQQLILLLSILCLLFLPVICQGKDDRIWEHYTADEDAQLSTVKPGKEFPLVKENSAYPGLGFFSNLGRWYQMIIEIQKSMELVSGGKKNVIGNIAWHPLQVHYYARMASGKSVKNICEVGYGAGHSSLLYLSVNPTAQVYSFDLFPKLGDARTGETLAMQPQFQKASLKKIRSVPNFSNRFHRIRGSSNISITGFAAKHPKLKCDFISIDGSHNPPQPFYDIYHFGKMAHSQSIMVLDDMHALKGELERAEKAGLVKKNECLFGEEVTDQNFAALKSFHKEFCSATYLVK